jgi:hypothetical protein
MLVGFKCLERPPILMLADRATMGGYPEDRDGGARRFPGRGSLSCSPATGSEFQHRLPRRRRSAYPATLVLLSSGVRCGFFSPE